MLCGLQRSSLIAGLSVTKGGQLRVNIWNATDGAIHLTPKTIMVNVIGAKFGVKLFGRDERKIYVIASKTVNSVMSEEE